MRTALWIARRYLLAPSHGYATFINWVSFVGLALGVTILTVVLSVMNGFDREITGRLLTAVPHALVTSRNGGAPDIDRLRSVAGVVQVQRFFQAQAMLTRGGSVHFLALAAFDAAGVRGMSGLLRQEALERLLATPGGIVLGANLAQGARLAHRRSGGAGAVQAARRWRAAGGGARSPWPARSPLAQARTPPWAWCLRDDILRLGLENAGVDGWRLRLRDPIAAPAMVAAVRAAAGGDAEVRFWMEDYGALFRAVKIEKAMMFALLGLIVAIAAFNIVSGQAMLVNDKRGDAALLATLGTPARPLGGGVLPARVRRGVPGRGRGPRRRRAAGDQRERGGGAAARRARRQHHRRHLVLGSALACAGGGLDGHRRPRPWAFPRWRWRGRPSRRPGRIRRTRCTRRNGAASSRAQPAGATSLPTLAQAAKQMQTPQLAGGDKPRKPARATAQHAAEQQRPPHLREPLAQPRPAEREGLVVNLQAEQPSAELVGEDATPAPTSPDW